jgi:hypothetical protein
MKRIALAAVGLGLILALAACAEDASGRDPGNPTADRTGPLPDGADASCVESYAPQAVSNRSFAFDGEVVKIGASVSDRGDGADLNLPGVTFEVREWFSGGQGDTVTVDMQGAAADSASSSELGDAYDIGSRLLVSGEPRWGGSPLTEPIAWGCGFSRYYDAETAAAWRDASRS